MSKKMTTTIKPSSELAARLEDQVAAYRQRTERSHEPEVKAVEKVVAETVHEETDCKKCGLFFDSQTLMISGRQAAKIMYCPKCFEALNKEREDEEEAKRAKEREARFLERWEVIPERYREDLNVELLVREVAVRHAKDLERGFVPGPFDAERFRANIHAILNHEIGNPKGVGVVGRTRRGKTRVIAKLLERYARAGESFEFVNMAIWGTKLSGLMSEDMAKANRWIERLCRVKVLVMDDLGKQRNTERVMSELYRIVEDRTNRGLRILFTANERGDELVAKMLTSEGHVSDCAEPIVERLRESCQGYVL